MFFSFELSLFNIIYVAYYYNMDNEKDNFILLFIANNHVYTSLHWYEFELVHVLEVVRVDSGTS